MGRKKKEVKPELTKTFILEHAKILKDFGGDKTQKQYVEILSQYKDNPAKFDFIYSSMRDELLKFN